MKILHLLYDDIDNPWLALVQDGQGIGNRRGDERIYGGRHPAAHLLSDQVVRAQRAVRSVLLRGANGHQHRFSALFEVVFDLQIRHQSHLVVVLLHRLHPFLRE